MPVKAGHYGTRLQPIQMVAAMIPTWYAIDVPASTDEMVTIVAIAYAESDGYCQAVSPVASDGTQGFGVCQIESSHTEFGTFDASNSNHWQNPIINMQMARSVFVKAGGKFDPWSTFGNGRYRMYQIQAQAALTSFFAAHPTDDRFSLLGEPVSVTLGQVPEVELQRNTIDTILHYLNIGTYSNTNVNKALSGPVSATESFFTGFAKFLTKLTNVKNWTSIGYVLGGLVVMGVAISRIGKLGSKAGAAGKLAAKAAIV